MTNPPPDIPILDEDAVGEIAARDYTFTDRCERQCVVLSVEERDALCSMAARLGPTRQALNESSTERELALQSQLEQVTKERDDLQVHIEERDSLLSAAPDAATSMRSACVEKVGQVGDEVLAELADELKPDGSSFSVLKREAVIKLLRRLKPALESVSIQEQKLFPCGAPRPDDGSECLYGVCPRPRDGCSEYCWQHHRSQCAIQEQEVKQS